MRHGRTQVSPVYEEGIKNRARVFIVVIGESDEWESIYNAAQAVCENVSVTHVELDVELNVDLEDIDDHVKSLARDIMINIWGSITHKRIEWK